jgi:tRNA-Thr(GGU) m(6)t(6)A37 methyltransferase TsaA
MSRDETDVAIPAPDDVICLRPIGYVARDPVQGHGVEPAGPEDIDVLRASPARLVIQSELEDALLGLAPGVDVLVLTYFHRASHDVLQVHPRGDLSRPMRGVFLTRSPSRPNPIGLTSARVLAVEGTIVTVVGLDALDGSPVLDIKSLSESFDRSFEPEG